VRRTLYRLAWRLGDVHAVATGRIPQRLVRRLVYRRTSRLARWVCRRLGMKG
jgi:hypothetical protein